MRIAVCGARGQLGAALVDAWRPHHEVLAWDRHALDLTDGEAVRRLVAQAHPDVLVNAAGYNAVDAAEEAPVAALQANVFAVRHLARAAQDTGATLVQYSTDFVFDGEATVPMEEDHPPHPRSVYAVSKLLGEWFAMDAPRSYVLRVESLFGQAASGPSKGTLAGLLAGIRAGHAVPVFTDRVVSPTYVHDAADATLWLLERQSPAGVYHCVNSGHATWAEVAGEVARLLGVSADLRPVRTADVELPAARPRYCALSNAKLRAAGVDMPSWQDALRRWLSGERQTA